MNGYYNYKSSPEAAVSVSELNEYIKMLVESDMILADVYVRGEISNFKNQYATGHLYFTLKDDGGTLNSVMFSSYASKLVFSPENGMKVIAHGRISLYSPRGQYQIYVSELIPDGAGSLHLAFEQLKSKLASEGLFDQAHKKLLPRFPKLIGIVTSTTGAAVRDMLNIVGRRYPLADVIIYPSLVQGNGACAELCAGINYFNSLPDRVKSQNESMNVAPDVIIIGRGGGSIEDLWEFNREELARTIYKSRIPVISAVGHETDFTICDFAADVRAPTPSAAAELVVPDKSELKKIIFSEKSRMDALVSGKLEASKNKIARLSHSAGMRNFEHLIDNKRLSLVRYNERIDTAIEGIYKNSRSRLAEAVGKLEALSPLSVMARGYAIVTPKNQSLPLKTVKNINNDDIIDVHLNDGIVSARVVSSEETIPFAKINDCDNS